ncbi:MAG TPA: hypothetical protein VF987_09360, partial [Rhodospirillales bacterium]
MTKTRLHPQDSLNALIAKHFSFDLTLSPTTGRRHWASAAQALQFSKRGCCQFIGEAGMVTAGARGPFHTVSAESDKFDDEKYRGGSVTIRNRNKTVLFRAALFFVAAVIAASPVSADDEQAGGPIKDGYGRKVTNSNKNQVIFYGIATRALLYVDDGDRHQLLNVDGGVENTRVGWIATGKVNENVTVIGHVEMNTQLSNRVSSVNLNGTEGADETEWGT